MLVQLFLARYGTRIVAGKLTASCKIPMMAVYPRDVLSRYWKRYNTDMIGIRLLRVLAIGHSE